MLARLCGRRLAVDAAIFVAVIMSEQELAGSCDGDGVNDKCSPSYL